MSQRVLVVGGNIQCVQAALDLADSEIEVALLEPSAAISLEGVPESPAQVLPYMPSLLKAASHPNIKLITGSSILEVKRDKLFSVKINKSPRYVNPDACASCGRCEQACPVELYPKSGANGRKAIHRSGFGLKSVPSAYVIEKKGLPPCSAACPAGINVHGYVALISKGKFSEALDIITEAVAFPRVLGRVCSHPCENNCARGKIDKPVAACALKRYVADHNSTESSLKRAQESNGNHIAHDGPPEVAIIGAGPAGLTAARDLARLGHKSIVFEALPVPGGMITVGMPRFRLPREIRQADINEIIKLGIEIKTSTRLGKDISLADLRRQFKATLIATGAHKNQKLGIPGEGLSGVIDSVALLQALNLRQPITVGSRVVVIGGGYTAIDSARTAIRLHCDKVQILYRRSVKEMPANPEEVAEAQEEGVEIQFLVAPVRILGKEGKVTGIECIRMGLGEADRSGRRRPIPIQGSEFVIEADTVIVAVGQRSDLSFLEGDTTLTEGRRYIVTGRLTMATKIPGIFAAGDVTGETGTLIEAIAEGRRAATSIDRYLRGEDMAQGRTLERASPVEINPDQVYIPPIERQRMPCLEQKDRVGNFEEVDLGLTTEMAIREAQRCLNCADCSDCRECERACELEAINHQAAPEEIELEVSAIITGASSLFPSAEPGIYVMPPARDGDLTEASALAAQVIKGLGGSFRGRVEEIAPPEPYFVRQTPEFKAGIIICRCGGGISQTVNTPEVAEYCRSLDRVAWCGEVGYLCTREAAAEVKEIARQQDLTHLVVAACACCNLGQICFSCSDRRMACKSNLLGTDSSCEFVNIREHCAWVHRAEPEEATAKAKGLIKAGLARARLSPIGPQTGATKGRSTQAMVEERRCRGCGTCVSTCQSGAIVLRERKPGVFTAQVERRLCSGCGACIAGCPTGALSQEGYRYAQIAASLEAVWT